MSIDRTVLDRIADFATVLLISLAAVGTAWCGYQSARWNALEAFDYTKATAVGSESTQWAERANAHEIVDIILFVDYQRALHEDPAFASFMYARFDPPLKKAVDAWLATNPLKSTHAPASPFAMGAYHLIENDRRDEATRLVNEFVTRGAAAQDVGDNYLLQTVLFATASFLGGIALKVRSPGHLAVTIVGFAIFAVACAAIVHYPVR